MSRSDDLSALTLVHQRLIDNDFDVYRARTGAFDLKVAAFSAKSERGVRIAVSRMIDGCIYILHTFAETGFKGFEFWAFIRSAGVTSSKVVYIVPSAVVQNWVSSQRGRTVQCKWLGQERQFQEIPFETAGLKKLPKANDEFEVFRERWDLLESV